MKALTLLMFVTLLAPSAHGDPSNLYGGILAAHYVPEIPARYYPPGGDWCEAYRQDFRIESLDELNVRIDVIGYEPVIWYVIAAWEPEEKQWCGTEFGFGDYDPIPFAIADAWPCFPDQGLQIPTPGWPGPGEGCAFVTTTEPWAGNWEPVYFFAGYAYQYYGYGSTMIPIAEDPATGFIGFGNCLTPPEQFEVLEPSRWGLGINEPGIVPAWSQSQGACCVIGLCSEVTQEECDLLGGEWLGYGTTCDPNPCPAVCCFWTPAHLCEILLEEECVVQNGIWHAEWGSCDPNPCVIYTPTGNVTWGRIKSFYR